MLHIQNVIRLIKQSAAYDHETKLGAVLCREDSAREGPIKTFRSGAARGQKEPNPCFAQSAFPAQTIPPPPPLRKHWLV